MKKRLICALLAFALLLCSVPAIAAEETTDDEGILAEETAEVPADEATVTENEDVTPEQSVPADDADDYAPVGVDPEPHYPVITKIVTSAKGLKITYTSYPDAPKYQIFSRDSGTTKWKKIGVSASTAFEYTDPTSNVMTFYTVRAIDNAGSFISDYDRTGYAFTFLSTPALSAVENTTKGQKFSWKAVEGAPAYRVYGKPEGSWVELGVTTSTSFVNPDVTSGKTYLYTVRCIDINDGQNLSYFVTSGLKMTYVATPHISSFSPLNGGTRINIAKSAGASKYRVFVKNGTSWKKLADVTASYDHMDLADGTAYTYTVRAIDSSGKFISGYDTAGVEHLYLAPPSFSGIVGIDDGLSLRWSESEYAAGYRIYRKPFGGSWASLGATDQLSFIDDSCEEGTLYTYTLRYVDEDGALLTSFIDTGVYYVDGALAEGTYEPSGYPITFKKGKVSPGYVTKNGKKYYINASGKIVKNAIVGSKTLGYTYADANGVCCTSKEIELAATFMAQSCSGSTLKAKSKSGFMVLAKNYPYARVYGTPSKASDVSTFAINMFTNKKGNCFSYAAAYTCIAKLGGYRARIVIGTTEGSPHGWVEVLVDGKWLICDPDANIPHYGVPAYRAYMMKRHYWQLTPKMRFELTFDSNGKAVWKKV